MNEPISAAGLDPKLFFRTEADVEPYSPSGHTGTVNRRLVSPETGATQMEVLIGRIEPGEGASPHYHPGIDQFCWILEGRAEVEISDMTRVIGPGESCFFPAGLAHTFTAIGDEPVRVLICYAPPYGEGARVNC
ncbi:cupin domain-containing protein [Marinovum sp. SP66]|uniref:cupin domain-containing protein n=1 Tax=Marinovum sp. SP66 TaxID=3028379 RepID=UPI00237B83EA|nr:cupin domain-containing protein [Marinovum sp. SP66]MDD9739789.1 cupin domain-containing protein [Marinovum sp. SP66]